MTKFAITKKVSLDFLGEAWKDCSLEFTAFTLRDLKEKFPAITATADTKDVKALTLGMENTISLLEDHFIKGTGINEKGEVVEISKEDIIDLPAEVITKAFSFLSELSVPTEKAQ